MHSSSGCLARSVLALLMVFVLSCVEATGSSKDVALQTSVEKSSLQHGPSLSVKSKGEALHAQKSAGVALAAVKGGKTVGARLLCLLSLFSVPLSRLSP